MKNNIKKLIIGMIAVFGLIFAGSSAFAAIPGVPTLSINTNPGTSPTTATFKVSYQTNGDILTTVAVRYGVDSSMSQITPSQNPTGTAGTLTFNVTGLVAGRTYYFQAMGVSSSQSVVSSRYTFPTGSYTSPTIQTYTMNQNTVTSDSAIVSGYFNDNGSPLSNLYFEYGTNINSPATQTVSFGSKGTVSATLSGLSSSTKYYYRLVGVNGAGTVNGSWYFFTTNVGNNNPPTNSCRINYFDADDYTISDGDYVDLSWSTSNCSRVYLSDEGSVSTSDSSYRVRVYDTTTYELTAYGNNGSDSDSLTIRVSNNNNNDNNRDCNYYNNCNHDCNYYNNCNNSNNYRPQVSTTVVSSLKDTSAVLHGTINTNGVNPTYAYFEYGTTPNLKTMTYKYSVYGSYSEFTKEISNLNPNTRYYFRIVAENTNGISKGDILYFTTAKTGAKVVTPTVTTYSKSSNTTNGNSQNEINQNNKNGSLLGASAGSVGGTFLPATALGWLLMIIFILVLLLIVRWLVTRESPNHLHR